MPTLPTSLDARPEDEGATVYVVDKGLIRFSKFVGAILAVFVLVGLYLFGFDIKEASETASESKITVQEVLLEIERQRAALDSSIHEIEGRIKRIEGLEDEILKHRDETRNSAEQIRRLVSDLQQQREEAFQIVVELRTLGTRETSVASRERDQRGIDPGRGKLWGIGATLKFRFLDGAETEKNIVRSAIEQWAEHVNLRLVESESPASEIRISFEQPGSWSYIGTDALGIPFSEPTINYGTLVGTEDRNAAMQVALHEFGHVLGLVHEFQNPSGGEIFDPEATKKLFQAPPNLWSESQVEMNLLRKAEPYPGHREYDPSSVMNYTLPSTIFLPGKGTNPGFELSGSDQRYVASLYPTG